jgi:pheromone shutdown protein TraB
MITLVGVGHVFQISPQVRRVIHERRADAVCVELDPRRYQALLDDKKGKDIPLTYRMLSMFQKRLAKQFGGEVGQEMISAVEAAREIGADALLIDVDAGSMFNNLWRKMPFKEKVGLMFSSLVSMFASKRKVERELEEFEHNEELYLGAFESQFPTLKKVLIDDRNELMASRIGQADDRYGNVVAIVGDGHVEGMRRLLVDREVQVIRLSDLRSMSGEWKPEEQTGTDASFSFSIRM